VQGIVELSDGSSLHVTIARWPGPDGSLIEGLGVQPNIVVGPGMSSDDDASLLQALRYLADELLQAGTLSLSRIM
jgi:C-terminal processing protease CtpA/Prc